MKVASITETAINQGLKLLLVVPAALPFVNRCVCEDRWNRIILKVYNMAENGARPVTRDEMHEELAAFESRIDQRMSALQESLTEKMRDLQTETLRAFHGWASPVESRLRGTNTFVMGFEERLALLEERMRKMESDRL